MQIWKSCDKKWSHNDVITKNNENADVREMVQNLYLWKVFDESYS